MLSLTRQRTWQKQFWQTDHWVNWSQYFVVYCVKKLFLNPVTRRKIHLLCWLTVIYLSGILLKSIVSLAIMQLKVLLQFESVFDYTECTMPLTKKSWTWLYPSLNDVTQTCPNIWVLLCLSISRWGALDWATAGVSWLPCHQCLCVVVV